MYEPYNHMALLKKSARAIRQAVRKSQKRWFSSELASHCLGILNEGSQTPESVRKACGELNDKN